MQRRVFGTIIASAALTAGCASISDLPEERIGEATLRLPSGIPVGSAQLIRTGNRVTLAAVVGGLEPGPHGFHLHTTGKCNAPDFSSAGGHLNPAGNSHGSLSAGGSHLGDLPNLEIATNRSATVRIDLAGDSKEVIADIFDSDGTAIVIHAKPDDYRTDPSGDAGSRVACGVIETP